MRVTKTTVAAGGRVSTQVLGDWVDPDGDPVLPDVGDRRRAPTRSATSPTASSSSPTPATAALQKSVTLTMSDGRAEGSGSLSVTVKPVGAGADHGRAVGRARHRGQEITIRPMPHVRGGNGTAAAQHRARRRPVSRSCRASRPAPSPSRATRCARTTSSSRVTDGDQTATGLVRVDVVGAARTPTPARSPCRRRSSSRTLGSDDRRPDARPTSTRPAACSSSPGCSTCPRTPGSRPRSSTSAWCASRWASRSTADRRLQLPHQQRARGGRGHDHGRRDPAPDQLQPPIATDDTVTVRVGDVIDIPVLDNDEQPDGEPITLRARSSRSSCRAARGCCSPRATACATSPRRPPGNYTAVYSIAGPDGQTAQARVNIAVREVDVATNNAPVAAQVTARVLAGETVSIEIPLTGIDPDGDSVQLIGVASNPEKGSVLEVGPERCDRLPGRRLLLGHRHLHLHGHRRARRARDRHGAGRHQRPTRRRPQPGRERRRGRRCGRAGPSRCRCSPTTPTPTAARSRVTSRRPEHRRTPRRRSSTRPASTSRRRRTRAHYSVVYTIENEFGGTSSELRHRRRSIPNAPLAYPVANDTVLAVSDVLGRTTVDVAVLDNVFFADGDVQRPRRRAAAGLQRRRAGAAEQEDPGADRRQEPDHPVLGVASRRRHDPLVRLHLGAGLRRRPAAAQPQGAGAEGQERAAAARSTSTTTWSRSAATRVRLTDSASVRRPTPTAPTSSSTITPCVYTSADPLLRSGLDHVRGHRRHARRTTRTGTPRS